MDTAESPSNTAYSPRFAAASGDDSDMYISDSD